MVIEHVGFTVSNPLEIAKWYEKNLGCIIQFQGGNEDSGMVFISDSDRTSMLELIKSKGVKPTGEIITNSAQFHVAFKSENPENDRKKLEDAGAVFVGEAPVKQGGDVLFMLKDPWGNMIQLAKRGDKNKFNK